MALNEPYNLGIQFDIKDFEGGSYADLTYQVIQRMIKAGPSTLRPLYKSLVSVISNTAPYVKGLSKDSSEGIFALVKTFSDVDLLKKREETSRILSNLFEAINYILLYHHDGNEEFLVALIKFRDILQVGDVKLAIEVPKEVVQEQPKIAAKVEEPKVEEQPEQPKESEQTEGEASNQEQAETSEQKPDQKLEEDKADEGAESKPSEDSEQTQDISDTKANAESAPKDDEQSTPTTESTKVEESKDSVASESATSDKAETGDDNDAMVDVPLDEEIKHDTKTDESSKTEEAKQPPVKLYQFLTPEWESNWKEGINLPNIKQAIQYTDDKARSFLTKNPSPDQTIEADKFVEFLKKSSLKGLLPNQGIKILVTTYNGNSSIDTWAISYIWGQIFMRQQDIPMFNVETIKMFKVNFVQQQ